MNEIVAKRDERLDRPGDAVDLIRIKGGVGYLLGQREWNKKLPSPRTIQIA